MHKSAAKHAHREVGILEKAENRASIYSGVLKYKNVKKQDAVENLYKVLVAAIMIGAWQAAAMKIDNQLLLPYPLVTAKAFVHCVTDAETVKNILITLQRVLKGFLYALAFGLPLGFLMGFSKLADKLMGGFIDSIRQVPIMAWVPLTIVWFGIGDGPTIFLIAFSGIFPVILNTIQGVRGISKDYFNAARSMGAGRLSIFLNVILPGALPDILTSARIAISAGWMSVI